MAHPHRPQQALGVAHLLGLVVGFHDLVEQGPGDELAGHQVGGLAWSGEGLEGGGQADEHPAGDGLPVKTAVLQVLGVQGREGRDRLVVRGQNFTRRGRLALGRDDLQAGEVVGAGKGGEPRFQGLLVFAPPGPLGFQVAAAQVRDGLELFLHPLGEDPAQDHGLLQGVFHQFVPLVFQAAGDELPGDEKHEHGGDQGQADKGQDQAGAQAGAEDPGPPLHEQLGEVAENQKGEQEKQDGVDVDQAEDQEAAGEGLAALAHQVDLQAGEGHHQEEEQADEDFFPAAFALSRGRRG